MEPYSTTDCGHCGDPLRAADRFCPRCGAPNTSEALMGAATIRLCPVCRTALAADAAFCPSCGAQVGQGATLNAQTPLPLPAVQQAPWLPQPLGSAAPLPAVEPIPPSAAKTGDPSQWGKVALAGLGGLLIGSLLEGHSGGAGWGGGFGGGFGGGDRDDGWEGGGGWEGGDQEGGSDGGE